MGSEYMGKSVMKLRGAAADVHTSLHFRKAGWDGSEKIVFERIHGQHGPHVYHDMESLFRLVQELNRIIIRQEKEISDLKDVVYDANAFPSRY